MAKHRTYRWFQFGILDLMILTTVVAIVTVLSRPVEVKGCKGLPLLVGRWDSHRSMLLLFPDGAYYLSSEFDDDRAGMGWTVRRTSMGEPAGEPAFSLECGDQRFVIHDEWNRIVVEWLNKSGSIKSRLTQTDCLFGPVRWGRPHGTWREKTALPSAPATLEYDNGLLVDAHQRDGSRDWATLATVRGLRGLPELSERDFPGDGKARRHP